MKKQIEAGAVARQHLDRAVAGAAKLDSVAEARVGEAVFHIVRSGEEPTISAILSEMRRRAGADGALMQIVWRGAIEKLKVTAGREK